MACKRTLLNSTLTGTTTFTLIYSETFQVAKGLNTIYLNNSVIFNPLTQNIFYKSINTQLTYYQSSIFNSYDLIWKNSNPNTLQRMVDDSNWKFNLQVITRQYIYQENVNFDTVFYWSGIYSIQFNFGNFSAAITAQTEIWQGIKNGFSKFYRY
jgi:hypothetical protein